MKHKEAYGSHHQSAKRDDDDPLRVTFSKTDEPDK